MKHERLKLLDKDRRQIRPWSIPVLLLALLLNFVFVVGGASLWDHYQPERPPPPRPLSLVIVQPPEEEEPEEEEDDDEPDFDGQIVEIAPPEEEEKPEDSDYLAEYDQTVEKETRADQFKVNPEILAKEFSREEEMKQEDLMDLDVEQPSTGAQVGNDRFDPDRNGTLASVPSPWAVTNKEGTQAPVQSSHTTSALSGAPQNDLLNEERAKQVNLNTKEFLYAQYLNRIRRLVNFYWQQNLDNLPRSAHAKLVKSEYTTGVNAVLDANGALEVVEVVNESGVIELDDAVVRAFRMAGPFPNPPEGLVEKDGRVYLPDMGFTVQFRAAAMRYQGIDPRAGVQFPGILKSPR